MRAPFSCLPESNLKKVSSIHQGTWSDRNVPELGSGDGRTTL